MTRARSSGVRCAAIFSLLAALVLSLVSGPAQVAAQADQDETGVSGNSYVSPTFGYSLEWDRTWEVEDETVEDDYNMLRLGDQNSLMFIEGYNFPTDAVDCVDAVLANIASAYAAATGAARRS